MSIDDDLFEDNNVLIDSDQINDNTSNEENDLRSLSPEYQALIQELKGAFENVDAFSFNIYPSTYLSILEQIQSLYRDMASTNAVNLIAPQFFVSSQTDHTYEQVLALKELERMIVLTGYLNEIVGHCTAILKDEPQVSHPGSYIAYCNDNFLREYKLCTMYLSKIIDQYVEYCNEHSFEIDQNLVDYQIKTFVSTIERQAYGQFVHGFELERVGVFENVVDTRDESSSNHARSICSFVTTIQTVVDHIQSDNALGIQEYFR